MSVGGFFWYAGAFALALGILIVVHEFGHFVAARLCGVKVLRFSVGFGKPLLSRRWGRDGTEWSLAAFPLGGYVKMLDEREGPVADEEAHRAFNRQSVGRRALIVVAGPLSNLLLAVVIYWGSNMVGTEELRPVLGTPPAGSIAARAGVQERETVRAVSGKAIITWQDLRWELVQQAVDREPVKLDVISPNGEIAFRSLDIADLAPSALEGDLLKEVGLILFRPRLKPVIGRVLDGSPAAAAGMAAGDEVVAVDGRPIAAWNELSAAIRAAPGRQLTLEILRAGTPRVVAVVPATAEEGGKPIGRIGIAAREEPGERAGLVVTVQMGPLAALGSAVVKTWETSIFSLRMIGRMISGDLSWKNVSGPVTIADYAGQSAHMGASHYLKFLALISISLGVLNLLPIPILDGGHLMYYLFEIIKGGPLSERIMEIGQQVGLAILLLLMAFAFYNDINRLVSG
ncbi:MAG: RIP metalloprotease RseP [Rhodocyclales bacterium GWA2_65_20]|nr:MAG: RIP metalloprotease RseP [Rhodocyclales bacterium GWA2_65_20]